MLFSDLWVLRFSRVRQQQLHPSALPCKAWLTLLYCPACASHPLGTAAPNIFQVHSGWLETPEIPLVPSTMILYQDTTGRITRFFPTLSRTRFKQYNHYFASLSKNASKQEEKYSQTLKPHPWTAKTAQHQNLRAWQLTNLPCASPSCCLLSDLPGIFTCDIFAASLQTPLL